MKFSGNKSELLYLVREAVRDPHLSLRASLRLAIRGLEYLSENPDVLILPILLGEYRGKGLEQNTLLLIGRADRISVALLFRQSSDKGICVETIPRDYFGKVINSLDSFDLKPMIECAEERHGFVDTAIFLSDSALREIKMKIIGDEREDPFLVAALGFLHGIREGSIILWPGISSLEIISQIQPRELLMRFADRFGLYLEYRRDLGKAAQGLKRLIRGLPRLVRGSPSFPLLALSNVERQEVPKQSPSPSAAEEGDCHVAHATRNIPH